MPDWITCCVEAVGIVILLIWIVVPIREFKGIFRRLKQEKRVSSEPTGGFEVIPEKKEGT